LFDEMPNQWQITQLELFFQGFLQVVFAEIMQAGRIGLANRRCGFGFAHCEQANRCTISLRGLRRLTDACSDLCNILCYRGHYLRQPPRVRGILPSLGSPMDITELLAFSAKQGASDLHLSAGLPPMIRVDGDVRRINLPALDHKQVHALIYDIMNDKQRKDFEEFLETDFSFEVPGVARFRVNAFNQNRGAGAVFRTIPSKVLTMEDLGMGEVFRKITDVPRGLVLVTGPTGSGKSTTLAAMLDYLNSSKYQHILTIEDPIEFVHESKKCLVNQREVHRDTLGFSEALRSALREDPDIILVGEMRDLETIRLALTAAETGHLVFGTLHTTSAAKTIDRVVDVFPAEEKSMVRSMLSESLQAVISQTLLKKVGGGRVAAHEIMIGTPAIRNLIREDKVAQMYSSIQTGGSLGMQTLDACLKTLVAKGLVTRDSAREKSKTPENF
jgi:twitching motility protein PilT